MVSLDALRLEIGKEAYSLLDDEDIMSICQKSPNVTYAAMLAFKLLYRNFQPSYRLGRMYQAESDRYEAYYRMYQEYARQVRAGKSCVKTDTEVSSVPSFV